MQATAFLAKTLGAVYTAEAARADAQRQAWLWWRKLIPAARLHRW